MSVQEDIALLRQLQQGNLTAFDELYLKYYALLCTSAYFFLKNEQESKDLVQGLFLDIWAKRLYLNFHEDVKGYLFRATKNRCLNHLKQQELQYRRQRGYVEFQDDARGMDPDFYQRMQVVLGELSGQKRRAIQMVYLHGKSYRDAADSMRISINSLKSHLKTGLRILRAEIKDG